MTQSILVIISLTFALFWLIRKFRKDYFSNKAKCDGCAVHKIYMAKIDQHHAGKKS